MSDRYFTKLERLDALIQKKATGTPSDLARKMNISVRTVHKYIGILRSLGGPIAYNKHRATYYYNETGSFCFKFMKGAE